MRVVPWERRCGGTVGMVLRRYRGVGTAGGEGGTVGGDVVQVVAVPWGWYCGTAVIYGDGAVMLCSAVP